MLFDPYTYDLRASAPHASSAEAALTDALLEVPIEARDLLWHGLTQAVEGAVDLWERVPAGSRGAPECTVQHAGKRSFQPEALREQSLPGWHRLVGIEVGLATEALERLVGAESAAHREALAEECARVGQLYAEMERRAGGWVAQALLRWELRLLRYRASPLLAPLIYA